jgi:hypothetical protein
MKRALVSLAVAALFLAALPLAAQTGTWTAVGSTGVVDESATAIYAFGTTNLTYLSTTGSVAPIVARYNVTNTWGVSDTPPWTTLEMGYFDGSPATAVRADLFQVDPCTGLQTLLCSVTSFDASAPTCARCSFTAPINFNTNLYYVQVTLSRTAATAPLPSLFTLRVR